MTDSKVEQVARALCAELPGTGDIEDHFKPDSVSTELWMSLARAAITATKEPTEAMEEAGVEAALDAGLEDVEFLQVNKIWQAMHDKALEESDGE